MIPQALRQAIQTWFKNSGLNDIGAIELLGQVVRPDLSHFQIQTEKQRQVSHYFSDLSRGTPPRAAEAPGVALSDADREMVKRCGLDPAKVGADLARERREQADKKRAADSPLTLTDQEAAAVRRLGLDPARLAGREVTDYTDWKRRQAAGGAA